MMKFIILNTIEPETKKWGVFGHQFVISIEGLLEVNPIDEKSYTCAKLKFNDGREYTCAQSVKEVFYLINEVIKWKKSGN